MIQWLIWLSELDGEPLVLEPLERENSINKNNEIPTDEIGTPKLIQAGLILQ